MKTERAADSLASLLANRATKIKPRTVGSCRFSPYFKAQWFDPKTLAWRDVPERFNTQDEARTVFTKKKEWRLMEVSMDGRRVL